MTLATTRACLVQVRISAPRRRLMLSILAAFLVLLPSAAHTPRSLDTVIAARRTVLTNALQSGSWMIAADHQNASIVGASRAKAFRRKPFTAADLQTIDSDGGPLVTGHDLLAVISDLIGNASSPQTAPLHYMEIGVAQGRNVFGALQVFGPQWHVTAFSFERINPPFEKKLCAALGAHVQVLEEWQSSDRAQYNAFTRVYAKEHAKGMKTSMGRIVKVLPKGLAEEDNLTNPAFFPYAATRYGGLRSGAVPFVDKSFTYMHADAYDANAWGTLAALRARAEVGPWQLVLSDAEHTDATVHYECDRYVSSKVIDFARPFAVVWDDEMMNSYCTRLLQGLAPQRLTFGSVRVMGRTSWHVWQFAASMPQFAVRFLTAQLKARSVPHYLILPNGKESTCCSSSAHLAPTTKPPSAD